MLAEKVKGTFIIKGGKKSKWVTTGPSDGMRIVHDRARATLKIWSKLT